MIRILKSVPTNPARRLPRLTCKPMGPVSHLRRNPPGGFVAAALVLILGLSGFTPLSLSALERKLGAPLARGTERRADPLRVHSQDALQDGVEAVVVRRAPLVDGRVQGSLRQLNGENVTLNSSGVVTGALLVPGTPTVTLNGNPTFGGTVPGSGSAQPSGYRVTLNGSASLGRLVTRTDPIPMPSVAPPTVASGTRNVTLNSRTDSPGDFATVRDLTLNATAGEIIVPPGAYRNFTANSGNEFVFGIAGSTQPAIYNLNRLTLNTGSKLRVVGPVMLTAATDVVLNASARAGSASNPLWLALDIAGDGLTMNNGSSVFGVVRAPSGAVTLNGNSVLHGSVFCDRLILSGNSVLEGEPGVLDSITPSRAIAGQSVTVTLLGINTHWVEGQTRASFGGEVSVGGGIEGDFGPINVLDSTTATAQIFASATATLAPRIIQVQTPVTGQAGIQQENLANAFTIIPPSPPGAPASTVTTIAGGVGIPGFADGPASAARFRDPAGIAIGADGSIYVADAGNNRIRVVQSGGAGISPAVSTLAGDGSAGFADGPGASARFNGPRAVALDLNGVIYVADSGNNRIRRIAPDGSVTTLAGDGTAGLVNGPGSQARFNAPGGLALDNQGNIYVADTGNASVRLISMDGTVSTVAGDGTIGNDDSPNVRFDGLAGVTFDGARAYAYIADANNHRLRRLDPNGNVITIAGSSRGFADGSGSRARFAEPSGIAIEASTKLVIADTINSLVRGVDPNLADPSVVTLAGTGERGLSDGSGDQARFVTPRGIAVAPSSAIIVADSGNHVLRRILVPPIVNSLTPDRGGSGATVTIDGERFDGRSSGHNTVSFTKAGGGQTQAQVSAATATTLTVVVPEDAATGPITVQTEGGSAASADFQLLVETPDITSFTPTSGDVGSTVTLIGVNLRAETGPVSVSFAGNGSNRLQALLTFVSPNEVRAIVPDGAVTGVIQLTNALGQAVSPAPFVVSPGQNGYHLTVAPSSATAVQAGTATFVLFLTSPFLGFTQLVSLTATGLPQGASAEFNPPQITAGAQSTLSVRLSGTNPGPGSYSFSIRGSGLVDGGELVRTANASLTVLAAGQTTLAGRVLSTEDQPIMGATASLDGKTATTDAAGAFLLSGVAAGVDRPLMVDGRTASAPNRTYPLIIEPATIVAGEANAVPYTFFLPAIDTQFEVDVVPGQTTVAANPRVPGLRMTIPPDARVRNRDGSPVARASITPLAIDRTPAPLPSNVGTNLVYTSQPGGAISDVPMPVVYPNLAGANPATRIALYAFNHDTVQWYVYGFGRVSGDGTLIEPEINPATGRPYGLPDFSWHFPNATPEGNPSPPDSCPVPRTPDTVDLATGVKIEVMTDVSLGGARGGIALTRVYTSALAQSCDECPLGRGWTHNYAVRLTGDFQQGGAGRVVFPEQVTGRLFNYARTDPDGALVFSTTATTGQLGDRVRKLTNGTFEYRYANGNLMLFESSGRLTALVDRNENTTNLVYTGLNLTRITDPVGRSLTLDYDSQNRIIRAVDPIGRAWSYTYEGTSGVAGAPGLTTVTDPLDNVMRFEYVTGGRLSKVTDNRGIVAKQITYDTNGRVIEQKFADDGVEQYSYGLAGRVVTSARRSDALSRTTSMRFNAGGYVIGTTDPLGQQSVTERDLTTNLALAVTGPCGCPEVRRQFDDRGNVTSRTDRLGQSEHYEYEPEFNNLTRFTDKLGRVTTYGYDSRGNLTSVTDALNQTMSLGYDQLGGLISVTDPMGHTSSVEYNSNGDLVAAVDALGNRTTFDYDAVGRATAAADPLGRRATLDYDSLDRVVASTTAAGATTQFGYDPNGNPTSVTDSLGRRWVAVYDARNRPISSTDPLGRVSRSEYNAKDELIAAISPSGRTVRYGPDQRGQMVSLQDPLGGVVRLTYDNRQNLIAVTDQRGNTTTFVYDQLSRPISERDPLGRSSNIAYDANDNIVEVLDRLGRRVGFSYDALDRLTRASYVDAVVDYAYDAASKLVRIDDTQGGQISWSYDDAGRVTSETTSAGAVTYAYNEASQRISMAAAGRTPVSYGFDLAGRVTSIIQGQETFAYDYDALSRRTSLRRPNGVTTAYSYDQVNRLARLSHAMEGSPPIEGHEYTYSADDEITSIKSVASTPMLPAARATNVADGANRIEQFGNVALGFDLEGQTIAKTNAEGVRTLQWDARGRLIGVTLPDSGKLSYSYDALGRRSTRTEGSATTTLLYDGDDVVLDRGSDLSIVDYINGTRIDEKLRLSGPTGSLYFLQDHLGSTTALLGSGGNVAERERYEPFGLTTNSSVTRYGFTGRELDSTTGLMYYRARWYDAEQGRFTSEDPLGLGAGLNLYEYGMNDPVGNRDPSGLLTLVIPGTNYEEDKWRSSGILERVAGTFCEHAELWGWSGANIWQQRKYAAKALAEFINNYAFAPGEKLNIVAHSHGGNIAFEASWLLNRPIDNLITLGTPIRGDYRLNVNRVRRHFQVYSDNDKVQSNGGYGRGYFGGGNSGIRLPFPGGEQGPASRYFFGPKTTNLNATYLVSDRPLQSHTDLWREAAPWEKQVRPALDLRECTCTAK